MHRHGEAGGTTTDVAHVGGGTAQVVVADAADHLRTMATASVDCIITDPPHGLGQGHWDVPPTVGLLRECLRVLRPGSSAVFIADTRTQHRLICSLEEAGFQYEDLCMWVFATGRPRSDAQPRPAFAPIIVTRAPGPRLVTRLEDAARIP